MTRPDLTCHCCVCGQMAQLGWIEPHNSRRDLEWWAFVCPEHDHVQTTLVRKHLLTLVGNDNHRTVSRAAQR